MANPLLLQRKNGKYLWFSLLGLGFQPETEMSVAGKTNINVKHINLGPNMFDKPNKDAFYIVTHFLLLKLNPTRFSEAYRHCWPVLNHKADAEFRKVTCAWLREIMDETANAGSKVVASLFLSPGGPKFVSLMLHLANHVMLQEMKTFTTGDSWVPEAAALPSSSLDMAVKRLNPIHSKFLKAAVDQDRFLHEYQRRAQILVKSERDAREQGARYDELLKRFSSISPQEGTSAEEKTKRVRSLWSTIDEMLSTISEEQQAVESVLKGEVDQYILDGTNRVLKIPRTLLERVEQLPNQLSSGNVYESGQLNLLCVLELLNHSLQLLREERSRVSQAPKPHLDPEHLQEKCQQMARALQDLHLIRQKISKEGIPEVRSTIRELEAEWDRRWIDTLKDIPLVSFLNEDPALGFLSPMAPLSFEPAADTSYRGSVFSQFPASLLEEKPAESEGLQLSSSTLMSSHPATAERTKSPVVTTVASSQANTSLDWLFDTPPAPPVMTPSVPPPQASVRKTAHVRPKASPTKCKSEILNMECDNLADQFADAIATTSPTDGRVKGLDLEGLLSTLHGDPFSTRKQLHRTPESLIMDVKSSWRKALEEDEAEKKRRSVKFDDTILGRLTPLEEPSSFFLSPASPSKSAPCSIKLKATTHSSPPVDQQEVKSTLLWDTFNTEAFDTPSGTGSSAVQFSLEHETLPELPSCDSLLSLDDDDEALDMKSEDEEDFSIPALKCEGKRSPLKALHHLSQLQQAGDDGSFMESWKRTPECLLTGHAVPSFDKDWSMEPAKSKEATDRVFSLDLDTLETPSPPKKQEYSLPKLITFSPIDDMKC
ncbi:HAUS augmin-like complex subunit 6 [Notolabrus celidotus]|uniref:HAUS augmin-like complex subunit 6 n=1 Tax=Notolabrus celidotus TaxID=1203425 RepID=UPI00148F6C3D|nr:HAUS augmin-like complex subunit 6 [Notolabrus celidotus]